MAIFYVLAGIAHFRNPQFYLALMPPDVPWQTGLINLTGIAEILGGIGLLVPNGFVFARTRDAAAWGIVALLVCIYPVHINMCLHPDRYPQVPLWGLWLRLLLQLPLIAWAWSYTRAPKNSPSR
jgi:uncharacterized membrane protein